ncbi:MAG: hypothetical protein HOJ54_03585 [Phycisphaerae bacterium]|nr:hypothetical protein [Phycisphaerae bacterium]
MSLNCCDLRGWFIATVILMAVLPVQTSSAADQSFLVDQFDVAWREIGPDLPSTQSLRDASVFLGRTARGYTGLTDGVATVRTELASLDRQRGVRIDVAGLGALAAGIEKALEAEGMLGARVQAFLQHQSGGSSARFHAWFLADIPLPGLSPNADVPNDLVPVVHMASADAIVTGIKLKWEGKVPYLPSPRAFLDSIELHVSVNGQAVIVDANSTADVGRLRYDSSLRWSPAAIDELTRAITESSAMLGADVLASVSHTVVPSGSDHVQLDYVVEVTSRKQAETVVAETEIPAPKQIEPAPIVRPVPPPNPVVAADSAEEEAPGPLNQPTLAPKIEGVSIRWPEGLTDRGNPNTLFALTTVRLRLVGDEIQAGWSDVGDVSSLTRDLAVFPARSWRPSASRAVRHAVEDRLEELGMTGTRVSDAIMTEGDQSLLVLTLHPPERSDELPPLAEQSETIDDTFYYVVWPFEVMYSLGHSQLPAASSFEHLPIELGRDEYGFVPAGEGEIIRTTLGHLNDAGPMRYDPTALLSIERAIVGYLTAQDLMGVTVQPLASQIPSNGDMAGRDLREGGTELTLVTTVARVAEIQTSASGDRVSDEERINNPLHKAIAAGSPLAAASENGEGDLVKRREVEDYLHFLSRHPGRDIRWTGSKGSLSTVTGTGGLDWETEAGPVDVETPVAAAGDQDDMVSPLPGGVTLDYMVAESKPWTAWYEFGNTGTKAEGYLRQRVGFYTSQLTDNDDILSLQYATSNFSNTNALVGNYEAPLALDGRLRWGVNGSWSQYFADQFGATLLPDAFTGFSWSGGGDLRLNVYQDGPLFVDVIGGGRLQHLGIENNILWWLPQEEASFAIPYGMVQMDRDGEWSSFRASVGIDGNVLSHDDSQLALLGAATNRPNLANLWARLNWSGSVSTYLEPLLNNRAWSDPASADSSTLAHEVYFGTSGQYAFGNRLMPQFQAVSGGPGTNRGYPVSVAAGDNAVNFTGEYRFHVPRSFAVQPQPGTLFGEPFRYAPQRMYGRADWDLMLLGFVDYSWLTKNDKVAVIGETDQTLISAGVGFEFQFKRNMRVRLDWGWALRSLEGGLYDAGHNRVYVQASLSF